MWISLKFNEVRYLKVLWALKFKKFIEPRDFRHQSRSILGFFRKILSQLSNKKKTLEVDALYLEILGIKVGQYLVILEEFLVIYQSKKSHLKSMLYISSL